jgi:predicted acylesterase/phospholipase RssA
MRNIRILSLDGGGMKGLFSATFMKRFCQDAGIDPTKIWDYFDIIAGTSIGTIMGGGYALGKTPEEIIDFFKVYGSQIFTSSFGTPMPVAEKLAFFLGATNFPLGGSFYGDGAQGYNPNSVLVNQVQTIAGDMKMSQFKTNMLITAVEKIQIDDNQLDAFYYRPVIFSNLNIPRFTEGQDYLAWQVILASASAPLYFPPTVITGTPLNVTYIDGAVYQNNPASLALVLANIIEPSVNRICILSVGCGLGTVGFFDPAPPPPTDLDLNVQANFEYLSQILDVEGAGSQETISKQLELLSLYGSTINGANLFYYRFQTVFDPSINTELDNSSPEFLEYMQSAANAQYNKDALKIGLFIQKLQA